MKPPSVPERLARFLCLLVPSRYREDVYGDLVEEARARARSGWSRTAIRGWMLLQLARSIPLLNLNAVERAMDHMDRPHGGTRYGIASGLVIFVLLWLAPQPAGTLVLVAWITIGLFAAGVATLHRTPFVFMGTGMLLGALETVVIGSLIVAGVVSAPPVEPWTLVFGVATILVFPALMWLEKRRAPEEYETWKRVARRAGVVDFLFLRHIPYMR